jgi:hypothetical protein
MEKRVGLLESKLQTVKEELGLASGMALALLDELQHISSNAKLLGGTGTAIVKCLDAFEKDLKSTLRIRWSRPIEGRRDGKQPEHEVGGSL